MQLVWKDEQFLQVLVVEWKNRGVGHSHIFEIFTNLELWQVSQVK